MTHDPFLKSLPASLGLCVPSLCLCVYLMQERIDWAQPAITAMVTLAVGLANIGVIVALDPVRRELGRLTMPALLLTVSVVLLYTITEAMNRFVQDIGYTWLFPLVVITLGVSFIGIFAEAKISLKFLLAINALTLAILWGLGVSGRLSALPF